MHGERWQIFDLKLKYMFDSYAPIAVPICVYNKKWAIDFNHGYAIIISTTTYEYAV